MAGCWPTSSLPSFLRGQYPAILTEQDLPIKNFYMWLYFKFKLKIKIKKIRKLKQNNNNT